MSYSNQVPKVLVHQSELDFISRCVMDYPSLETGGDFFGFWSKEGYPVIQYVTGPGEKTRRTSTSFYQDIDYLKKCGAFLNDNFGLEHIGAWHSHHQLSLAHPSGGDVSTMRNALSDTKLPRFLISICNISYSSKVSINAFLFLSSASQDYYPCKWHIFDGISPVREKIERSGVQNFILPENKNGSIEVISEESKDTSNKKQEVEKPELAEDSYWNKQEGREYLKKVFDGLKGWDNLTDVELLQLADKRIAISLKYQGLGYEIQFPNDFPKTPPDVILKKSANGGYSNSFSLKRVFKSEKRNDNSIQSFLKSVGIIDENTVIIIRRH